MTAFGLCPHGQAGRERCDKKILRHRWHPRPGRAIADHAGFRHAPGLCGRAGAAPTVGARPLKAGERPAVLIGKDTRISGYMLEAALEAGFLGGRRRRPALRADADAGRGLPDARAAPAGGRRHLAPRTILMPTTASSSFPRDGNKLPDDAWRPRSRPRWTQPLALRAVGRARPGAAHRRCRRPLHRVLQEHLSQRTRPARPEDRRRLRPRRGLSRRAARVPRTGRRRGRHRRCSPDGLNINDDVGATAPAALCSGGAARSRPTSASRSTAMPTGC